MSEIFKAKCDGCKSEIDIVSPASLVCPKCSNTVFTFKKSMIFKCSAGHMHIGKKSNRVCEQCEYVPSRTPYRTFELKNKPTETYSEPPEEEVEEDEEQEEEKPKATKTKSGMKKRRRRKKK